MKPVETKDEKREESIPELGHIVSQNDHIENVSFETYNDCSVTYSNPPVMTWNFTDHEQKCDIVYVAVPVVSGSQNCKFSISEDGMSVCIDYVWPSAIFHPKELFADELNNVNPASKISANHPKIHALTSHLLNCGLTVNSKPRGKITVTLPLKVQREIGTWKQQPIKKADGSRIVLIELKGYQENVIINDADTSINFD